MLPKRKSKKPEYLVHLYFAGVIAAIACGFLHALTVVQAKTCFSLACMLAIIGAVLSQKLEND